MTIAAKPTLYADTRFRSRLEARWAVFFDALQIHWTYEPEVEAGIRYQPDFLLGKGWAYAEIKPSSWGSESYSQEKLRSDIEGKWVPFVRATDAHLVVCVGEPGRWENGRLDPVLDVFEFSPVSIQEVIPWHRGTWSECSGCGAIAVARIGQRVCSKCPQIDYQLRRAMNAVRDMSYFDAL